MSKIESNMFLFKNGNGLLDESVLRQISLLETRRHNELQVRSARNELRIKEARGGVSSGERRRRAAKELIEGQISQVVRGI